MSFGARALIRLGALKHNFNVIRTAAPRAKIMAVIKANAYGHGIDVVAHSLPDVDAFAVARVPEAVHLREKGVSAGIVLLAGVIDEQELEAALQYDLQLVVHCREQIELLESCTNGAVSAWLKFDTGMNRLGFPPHDARELIARLQSLPSVADLALMSHLASADDLSGDVTRAQIEQFNAITAGFEGAISLGNSAGTLGWPDLLAAAGTQPATMWIRPGIALFGISPFVDRTAADLGLVPAMQFEARLIAVKPLARGASVGYRGDYKSADDTMLGVVSAGYGDGYSRHFRTGTPILLNGRRVPVIGNVSMDMITVDLGRAATDRVGDVATLWGDGLPVEEVAAWANAIPYELVCGVMNREASEVID